MLCLLPLADLLAPLVIYANTVLTLPRSLCCSAKSDKALQLCHVSPLVGIVFTQLHFDINAVAISPNQGIRLCSGHLNGLGKLNLPVTLLTVVSKSQHRSRMLSLLFLIMHPDEVYPPYWVQKDIRTSKISSMHEKQSGQRLFPTNSFLTFKP